MIQAFFVEFTKLLLIIFIRMLVFIILGILIICHFYYFYERFDAEVYFMSCFYFGPIFYKKRDHHKAEQQATLLWLTDV